MNGIGGGVGAGPVGAGVTYHTEEDYEDNIYANSSSTQMGTRDNVLITNASVIGGNTAAILSAGTSKLPTISYTSNNLPGPVSSSLNPLSSLHGLTNQPQLIPSTSHLTSVVPSAGMASSFVNVGIAGSVPSSSALIPNSIPTTSSSNVTGGGRNQSNTCCLIDDGRRCHRIAGNASYSKRVQKTVFHKRLRLENDTHAQHIYICDYHKMIIQNARTRQKKDSDDDVNDGNPDDIPEVDLYQLQVNTLRRYKKHYKISSRPGLNKAQLSDILMRHFKTIPVQEKEVVTYFIYMVKSERNKLDNNRPDPGPSIPQETAAASDRF